MPKRNNFSREQRDSALNANAAFLKSHRIDGVLISEEYADVHRAGQIYYCENCLFCNTERSYFDVDHLVPDSAFRIWKKHEQSNLAINMMILCKSRQKGDLGCNQSKGNKLSVPSQRGLAYTLKEMDMNCMPLSDRPFEWT